jgi:TfoX/Sxy family transcriptional regulator of competence genes
MSPAPPPEHAVALYEALIATQPDIERKGKSSPYTSVNGNMFTILSVDGVLGMRLSAADREAFVKTFGTGLYEAHGTVMKEYVAVPVELLSSTEQLAPYLAKSYDYARSLKPKATTRKPRASS